MLEAKRLSHHGNVTQVLGGIMDTYCAQSNGAPVADVFTQYVSLINDLFR